LMLLADWFLLIQLMSLLRLALRLSREKQKKVQSQDVKKRILIFGAGDAGALAYLSLMAAKDKVYEVIGFLDDDPAKRHKTLYGRKVLGNRYNIEAVSKLYQVHEVLLAIPSAPSCEVQAIIQACQSIGVKYGIFPTLQDQDVRRGELTELFDMHGVPVDFTAVRNILTGKRILIAGVQGALGLELCRHLLCCTPERLIIVERYESYLTELMARLLHAFPEAEITPVLCASGGNGDMEQVFNAYTPQVVIHNATRKYPPFFPFQTESIIQTNYLLTFNLAKHAVRHGCEHFILVSSEEAENRGNPISDSLRVVEIGLRQFFASHKGRLVIARLCNILENKGSVISMLEEQIDSRENIILPHREAHCTFLSKKAAVHFILGTLVQVDTLFPEGGIFVCQHATTLPLLDIVQKLAKRKGLQVGTDISIRFLDHSTHNKPAAPPQCTLRQGTLVATAQAGISLLQEQPLPASSDARAAVQLLLDMQEHDLKNDGWQRLTHTMLLLSNHN